VHVFIFYFYFCLLRAIISNCSDSLKNMGLFVGPCWGSGFFPMHMLYFYFQASGHNYCSDGRGEKKKTECGQSCGDRIFLGISLNI